MNREPLDPAAMFLSVREHPIQEYNALPTSALIARLTGAPLEDVERMLRETPLAHVQANAGAYLSDDQEARLAVAFEFARRVVADRSNEAYTLQTPRDVYALYAPLLEDLPVEEFHIAILDAKHRIKLSRMITRGLLNSSLVHPREVFASAIAGRAAAIILVHNHPSGDPTPSADDRAITAQLVAAGRLLDIPVADHIIIGHRTYLSFAEAGLL